MKKCWYLAIFVVLLVSNSGDVNAAAAAPDTQEVTTLLIPKDDYKAMEKALFAAMNDQVRIAQELAAVHQELTKCGKKLPDFDSVSYSLNNIFQTALNSAQMFTTLYPNKKLISLDIYELKQTKKIAEDILHGPAYQGIRPSTAGQRFIKAIDELVIKQEKLR